MISVTLENEYLMIEDFDKEIIRSIKNHMIDYLLKYEVISQKYYYPIAKMDFKSLNGLLNSSKAIYNEKITSVKRNIDNDPANIAIYNLVFEKLELTKSDRDTLFDIANYYGITKDLIISKSSEFNNTSDNNSATMDTPISNEKTLIKTNSANNPKEIRCKGVYWNGKTSFIKFINDKELAFYDYSQTKTDNGIKEAINVKANPFNTYKYTLSSDKLSLMFVQKVNEKKTLFKLHGIDSESFDVEASGSKRETYKIVR